MRTIVKIKRAIGGIIARTINIFTTANPKHWVFGADFGQTYREGSKYLLEYMLKEHPNYQCTFITMNHEVYLELQKKGIPCEMNISLKGILTIASAGCVFTTHAMDLYYAYPKKNRRFFYLVHGQPLKIAQKALAKTEFWKKLNKRNIFIKLKNEAGHLLNEGNYKYEFVSATSNFLKQYMEMDFDYEIPVKVLGMPRNDALFDDKRMQNEKWIKGLDGKFIITYMPTHRAYGKGLVTPTPFKNRPDIQKWMKENNVVLLMKNHPNMAYKVSTEQNTECIIDITKMRLDPQVCIYHSDVLITDFSSVWMDYLLLKRPILFYIYDDFETNDAGTYYDIRLDPPGHFCYNENELFDLIQKCRNNYEAMKPTEKIIHKYHKYIDGKSCERYYNELTKI